MNVVKKIVEEAIKEQLLYFIKRKNILDDSMHGSREKHSIITAKQEIDEEVSNAKDKGLKVAVLNTGTKSIQYYQSGLCKFG